MVQDVHRCRSCSCCLQRLRCGSFSSRVTVAPTYEDSGSTPAYGGHHPERRCQAGDAWLQPPIPGPLAIHTAGAESREDGRSGLRARAAGM